LLIGSGFYLFFVNAGECTHHHWDDCRPYCVLSSGRGESHVKQMRAILAVAEVISILASANMLQKVKLPMLH
jgi:hypothetical protein